ncbi:MAG: DUF2764 domain-containing protein [Candidatus Omnitrophica bacterium]|nr:DUF2764 domain-containing protein [Candidatus Omnitrophota bacterium]
MGQYYYLIASLPDLKLDDYKEPYRVVDFVGELRTHLSAQHGRYLDDMLLLYNSLHLAAVALNLEGSWSAHSVSGFSFLDVKKMFENGEYEQDSGVMKFLEQIMDRRGRDSVLSRQQAEELLLKFVYERLVNHENNFIRSYFRFDLNLRNILSAYNKRKFNLESDNFIETEADDVVTRLKNSTASDFHLSHDAEYIDELGEIFDKGELLHLEKYLDTLRWQFIDEVNKLAYFEVDVLLGYLIRLILVERWIGLEEEKGRQVFAGYTGIEEDKFFVQ